MRGHFRSRDKDGIAAENPCCTKASWLCVL